MKALGECFGYGILIASKNVLDIDLVLLWCVSSPIRDQRCQPLEATVSDDMIVVQPLAFSNLALKHGADCPSESNCFNRPSRVRRPSDIDQGRRVRSPSFRLLNEICRRC